MPALADLEVSQMCLSHFSKWAVAADFGFMKVAQLTAPPLSPLTLWYHVCRPRYSSMLCHKDSTRWGCHCCKGSILSTCPCKIPLCRHAPSTGHKGVILKCVWKCFSYLVYFALNYPFIHQTVVPGCCTMAKQLLLIKSYGLSFQPSQHVWGCLSSLTALEMMISLMFTLSTVMTRRGLSVVFLQVCYLLRIKTCLEKKEAT